MGTDNPGRLDFAIRRLTPDVDQDTVDQLNVLLVQVSSSAKPLTLEYLRRLVATSATYVAEVDGHIVGHVNRVDTLHLAGMTSWIEDVVVDRQYRGNGIALALMQRAMDELPKESKHLNLTSRKDRDAAHRLYAGLGFTQRDGSDGKAPTTVWRWTPSN